MIKLMNWCCSTRSRPIHELYDCESCGHHFLLEQTGPDRMPLFQPCPKCGYKWAARWLDVPDRAETERVDNDGCGV